MEKKRIKEREEVKTPKFKLILPLTLITNIVTTSPSITQNYKLSLQWKNLD